MEQNATTQGRQAPRPFLEPDGINQNLRASLARETSWASLFDAVNFPYHKSNNPMLLPKWPPKGRLASTRAAWGQPWHLAFVFKRFTIGDGTECQKTRETIPGTLIGTRKWRWNRMPEDSGDNPRNPTRKQKDWGNDEAGITLQTKPWEVTWHDSICQVSSQDPPRNRPPEPGCAAWPKAHKDSTALSWRARKWPSESVGTWATGALYWLCDDKFVLRTNKI